MSQNTEQKSYDPDAYMDREHVSPSVANTEHNVQTRDEQVQWICRFIRASGDHPSLEGFLRAHIRIAEARGAAEQRRKDAELSRAKLFCQNEQEASDRTPERPDVVQWQKERNEFFLSSTLEVVTEYAAWRDKKDAEGQEPFAYVSQIDASTPKNAQGLEQFGEYCDKKYDYFQVPLYTRPANVTVLEARIAELTEAEQLARADAKASKARVMVLAAVLDGIKTYSEDTLAGPVGGGGDISWFQDGVEEAFRRARAALTREGGV